VFHSIVQFKPDELQEGTLRVGCRHFYYFYCFNFLILNIANNLSAFEYQVEGLDSVYTVSSCGYKKMYMCSVDVVCCI
jgi:hypothetical protein